MRLSIPEPTLEALKNGFKGNDLLGRAPFAHKLTALVDALDDPTVIALDGGWGSGKSFFLKGWIGEHAKTGGKARLIYFDAFKEDFLDDPLVSLVAALIETLPVKLKSERALNALKKNAWKIAKPVLRIGAAAATYGLTEAAVAALDPAIEAASKEATDALDAADKFFEREQGKRAAMEAFRTALSELTEPQEQDGPRQKIVIIVDELDRCRPDYALSLLETIKHFFNVEGVHFVLGVNLSELENSVRARYGAGCDARTYLEKFVTLTTKLPPTKKIGRQETSAITLYFTQSCGDCQIPEWITEIAGNWLTPLEARSSLSLRKIERIVSRLALLSTDKRLSKDDFDADLIICLHILRVVRPDILVDLLQDQSMHSCLTEISALFDLSEKVDNKADKRAFARESYFYVWLAATGLASSPQHRARIDSITNKGRSPIDPAVLRHLIRNEIDTWHLTD